MVVYHFFSEGVHPSCSITENRKITCYTVKFSPAHLGRYTRKVELLNKPFCLTMPFQVISNCVYTYKILANWIFFFKNKKETCIPCESATFCPLHHWGYLGPLPSSCGWQDMEEQQQRSHVTVPGYQEENEVKQAISIKLECTK